MAQAHPWARDVYRWAVRELPQVITELSGEGPERVMDVVAERYRAWCRNRFNTPGGQYQDPEPEADAAEEAQVDEPEPAAESERRSRRKRAQG